MQEQDEGGGQGAGHGVHQDVGHDVDGGHQEGQVDGGAAQQRDLGVLMITSDLSSSLVPRANCVGIMSPQAHYLVKNIGRGGELWCEVHQTHPGPHCG